MKRYKDVLMGEGFIVVENCSPEKAEMFTDLFVGMAQDNGEEAEVRYDPEGAVLTADLSKAPKVYAFFQAFAEAPLRTIDVKGERAMITVYLDPPKGEA